MQKPSGSSSQAEARARTEETMVHQVAKLEDRKNKKTAICEQTKQTLSNLTKSIFKNQTMIDINNENTKMIEKKTIECRNLGNEIFATFENSFPDYEDFDAEQVDLEKEIKPLRAFMLQRNEGNRENIEELTRFINQLTDKIQTTEETVKAENEKLLKDTQARKNALKLLCEQESYDGNEEIDDEKFANEIINLENKLRLTNDKLIKVEEGQQFKDIEVESENLFKKTISELHEREAEMNCELPQIEAQFENLKASLMDKNMTLQKLKQENKQLDDAIDDCERILENDDFSKVESEIKMARMENAEQIEVRNATAEELARITESVQVDDEEISYHNLEIEKLTVELNQVKNQRKFLNTKISEINQQYDEFCAYMSKALENNVALQKQISEIDDATLKLNKEVNNETKEKQLTILSLENINLQEIQENEKKIALLLEESSNLQNKVAQIETQLKEMRQQRESINKNLPSINIAVIETSNKINNLRSTTRAKIKQISITKKKVIDLYSAPPPSFPIQESHWNSDSTITDGDPNDLLNSLLKALPKSGSTHYNYKGTHSINLLAIVDASYKFIMVDIGAPGRMSDSGIFRDSQLGMGFEQNLFNVPPLEDNLPYVIVGDEAFPLTNYLMRPYPRRGDLDLRKKVYNYRLSRARRIVENAFGILVSKWRIFRKPIIASEDTVRKIVQACVCLHNFLIMQTSESENYVSREGVTESVTTDGVLDITRAGANTFSRNAANCRELFTDYFFNAGAVDWQWQKALDNDY